MIWVFLIGVTTAAFGFPVLGRRWRWCWFVAVAVALVLSVMLFAMAMNWMGRGDKGLGMLAVIVLLWPLVWGLATAVTLQLADKRGPSRARNLAIGIAGWAISSFALALLR